MSTTPRGNEQVSLSHARAALDLAVDAMSVYSKAGKRSPVMTRGALRPIPPEIVRAFLVLRQLKCPEEPGALASATDTAKKTMSTNLKAFVEDTQGYLIRNESTEFRRPLYALTEQGEELADELAAHVAEFFADSLNKYRDRKRGALSKA